MKKFNRPVVSIIMNCHNGEKFLKLSLKSILNQSFKNWELIFWNNSSTDNSKKIILSYKDERIKYFESKKFLKLYDARNLAIKKTKGKYICFLDTDDYWNKNKLKIQLNTLNTKKKYKFIFSNFFVYSQKTKKKKIYFRNKIPSGKITQYLLNNYKIGILSVMLNKSLLKKKKFNSKYNIIGDFDFFINLSLNEKFYCINRPLGCYRSHDSNYSKKTNLYAEELKNWIKKNSKRFEAKGYNLNNLRILFYKLKIKNFLNILGV